jgi:hypothetical protein
MTTTNGSLLPLPLRRRTTTQSAALLGALGGVLTERQDGPAIARHLGEVLARHAPKPEGSDLPALELALNRAFANLDLGVATVAADADSLAVDVREYPAVNETVRQPELVVFGLLEGFLTSYLNSLSGSETLSARLGSPPESTSEPLRFRYKRHDAG